MDQRYKVGGGMEIILDATDREMLENIGRCVGRMGLASFDSFTIVERSAGLRWPRAEIRRRELSVLLPVPRMGIGDTLPVTVAHHNILVPDSTTPNSVVRHYFGKSGTIEVKAEDALE
jgi:hypothetical protein